MLNLQSTQLSCYCRCPREWYYNYVLRRCKPPKPAMVRGSTFHKIGELYHGDGMSLDEIPSFIQAQFPHFGEHLDLCMLAFKGHLLKYPDIEIIQICGKPAVEVEFEMPLGDFIILRGKLDKIERLMKRNYVTDYKVTGQYLSDWYFSAFEMTYQNMLYSFVAREFLSEINGFMIDAISVKTATPKYQRQFYPILPNLDSFIRDVIRDAQHIADNIQNEDAFPRRYTSCHGKYGKCNYFEVCSSAERIQHDVLMSDLFTTYIPIYDEMLIGD